MEGSDITFDYTGTDPQIRGPINSPLSATISATITNDIYKGFIKKDATDGELVKMSKLVVLLCGIFSLMVALYSPFVLKLMLYAYQFMPPCSGLPYWACYGRMPLRRLPSGACWWGDWVPLYGQ